MGSAVLATSGLLLHSASISSLSARMRLSARLLVFLLAAGFLTAG
jgi:hypothetical protein